MLEEFSAFTVYLNSRIYFLLQLWFYFTWNYLIRLIVLVYFRYVNEILVKVFNTDLKNCASKKTTEPCTFNSAVVSQAGSRNAMVTVGVALRGDYYGELCVSARISGWNYVCRASAVEMRRQTAEGRMGGEKRDERVRDERMILRKENRLSIVGPRRRSAC